MNNNTPSQNIKKVRRNLMSLMYATEEMRKIKKEINKQRLQNLIKNEPEFKKLSNSEQNKVVNMGLEVNKAQQILNSKTPEEIEKLKERYNNLSEIKKDKYKRVSRQLRKNNKSLTKSQNASSSPEHLWMLTVVNPEAAGVVFCIMTLPACVAFGFLYVLVTMK